jgi:carbonyl reductase 1
LHGVKRVTDAFLPLIDANRGRIVNVSSGAASNFLKDQDAAIKSMFSYPPSWEHLQSAVKSAVASGNLGRGNGYPSSSSETENQHLIHRARRYGLSKAALTAYTVIQARLHPSLTVTSLSPGFIDTPMTAGYGAKLTPEQGCVSSIKCLFGHVTGCYYGSDGLRSPLTMTRDPGMPEYQGEDDPQHAVYNKT